MPRSVECPACHQANGVPKYIVSGTIRCAYCAAHIPVRQPVPTAPAAAEFAATCSACGRTFDAAELTEQQGQTLCADCAMQWAAAAAAMSSPSPRPRGRAGRESSGVGVVVAVVAGLVLLAGVGLWVMMHPSQPAPPVAAAPTWEESNRPKIVALIQEAQILDANGKDEGAFAKYSEVLDLIKGRTLADAGLIGQCQKAANRFAELRAKRRTAAVRPAPLPAPAPTPVAAPPVEPEVVPPEPKAVEPGAVAPTPPVEPIAVAPEPKAVEPSPLPPTRPVDPPAATAPVALTPTSKPADKAAADALAAATLLSQAANALEVREWQAALESLLDLQNFYRRSGATTRPATLLQPLAAHGLAVAYMALGRNDKAREPMDRAGQPAPGDYALLMNRTMLNLRQNYPMTVVRDMKQYLSDHPDPVDEQALNLLGTALAKAQQDERFFGTPLFAEGAKVYGEANTRLEKAHGGGELRWGIQWLAKSEAAEKNRELDMAVRAWETASSAAADANRTLVSAQAAFDRAFRIQVMDGGAAMASAKPALARAKTRQAETQERLTAARAAIPVRPWLEKLNPIVPDFSAVEVALGREPRAAVAVAVNPGDAARPPLVDNPPEPVRPPAVRPNPPADTRPVQPETPVAVAPRPPVVAPPVARPPRVAEKITVTRHAAAFAVGPDVLISAAGPLENVSEVALQSPDGLPFTAKVEKRDPASGLALLRATGQKLPYVQPGAGFSGGMVRCFALAHVSIFDVEVAEITGTATAPKGAWTVNLAEHPRLAGAPLFDRNNMLVGVVLAEREADRAQLPAVTAEQVQAFCGDLLPAAPSAKPWPRQVFEVEATFEKER